MDSFVQKYWWKWLAVGIMIYVIPASILFPVPRLAILNETIRVLHYHVTMWFGMLLLLLLSFIFSIRYLWKENFNDDILSFALAEMGVWMGMLGLFTGMIWANFTWGAPWSGDVKQNMTAIALLIYLAFFVLRNSLPDPQQRARISAVYNIFAFFSLIPLLFILPRMQDSLHPGNGGNPGFNAYDLDSNLRLVFYPAVLGWFLIGFWMATLKYRLLVWQHNKDTL